MERTYTQAEKDALADAEQLREMAPPLDWSFSAGVEGGYAVANMRARDEWAPEIAARCAFRAARAAFRAVPALPDEAR